MSEKTPEQLRREAQARAREDRKAQESARLREEANRRARQQRRWENEQRATQEQEDEELRSQRDELRRSINADITKWSGIVQETQDELSRLYEKQARGENTAAIRRAIQGREQTLEQYQGELAKSRKALADLEAREQQDRRREDLAERDRARAAAEQSGQQTAGPRTGDAGVDYVGMYGGDRGATPTEIALSRRDPKPDPDDTPTVTTDPAVTTTLPGNTGRGGGGGGNSGGGGGGGRPTMSSDDIADRQLWINYLRKTITDADNISPAEREEIFNIIRKGRRENWTSDKIANTILSRTKWGQREDPNLANFILFTNDPRQRGTLDKLKSNTKSYLQAYFNRLGYEIDDRDLDTYVLDQIRLGLSDDQLATRVANDVRAGKTLVRTPGGGEFGSLTARLSNFANNYGITLTPEYVEKMKADILDPADSRDQVYYENLFRDAAAEAYTPWADQIKAGRTLYDLTYVYRQRMADLLEVGEGDINWNDLMSRVVTQDNQKVSLWDFEKQVKNDPRWALTKNARNAMDSVGRAVLRDFGLVS